MTMLASFSKLGKDPGSAMLQLGATDTHDRVDENDAEEVLSCVRRD